MKNFLHYRDGASKGAALMIVLAFVVLLTGLTLAYFSRATTDRQLAHSSFNDTGGDLLAHSALDIVVGSLKQEILNGGTTVTRSNIQPQRSGDDASIPNLIRRSVYNDLLPPGVSSLASVISSAPVDLANPKRGEITLSRWNSHYLIPRHNTGTTIDSTPISPLLGDPAGFVPPDWVLMTSRGPDRAPAPAAVLGRYAFAVYDEGGLLDMSLAGYPSWTGQSGTCNPSPTPWLVNVGRKGIVAFADLTALGSGSDAPSPSQIDNIVGWRNYAMTQRTSGSFANFNYSGETDCAKQDFYGSYLLYFGDPPFSIESLADKLAASIYPFTSAANYVSNYRTDQAFMSRQQLLKLRSSLRFSQNVLQYMGTFSRERNWPAPDWPHLNGQLSDGRFNLNNLALAIPNPGYCTILHGKKVGWQRGNSRNHICGTTPQILDLFGLAWVPSDGHQIPGYWWYTPHTGPDPSGNPDPNYNSIICWDPNANRNQGRQADFFQILHYALNVARNQADHCGGTGNKSRTFAIGASLIDQYDSGSVSSRGDCFGQHFGNPLNQLAGCDLDAGVQNVRYATHTTVIKFGQGSGPQFVFGMEKDYDSVTGGGDVPYDVNDNGPHRPCGGYGGDCISSPQETPAPTPLPSPGGPPATLVINHAFSNVGEYGYGVDTSAPGLPTMDFSPPGFLDAPVLDFFSYNPISSAYPRAGVVNLYTRNARVLAAMLSSAWKTEAASANPNPGPSPDGRILPSEALAAANAIIDETQRVLAGNPTAGGTPTPTDMTRAIAARLADRAGSAIGSSNEEKQSIARALAEMGQTRTWNLFIDVIAQTGRYAPGTANVTEANKFIVEGEKRYWLHIALGRDLIQADGTPCAPGQSGCQVDVLGTQLEEVVE